MGERLPEKYRLENANLLLHGKLQHIADMTEYFHDQELNESWKSGRDEGSLGKAKHSPDEPDLYEFASIPLDPRKEVKYFCLKMGTANGQANLRVRKWCMEPEELQSVISDTDSQIIEPGRFDMKAPTLDDIDEFIVVVSEFYAYKMFGERND